MTTGDDKIQKNITLLVKDISKNPSHWQAYVDLVNALIMANNLIEAEELVLKSLTLFSENAEAQQELYYAAGTVYYTAADYARSTIFFSKITDEQLKHDATMMQAQCFYAQNKFKQSLAFALTAVQQNAQDLRAQVLLGNIWLSLDNRESAKQAFDAALALDDQDYFANFGRGVVDATTSVVNNRWLIKAKEINPKQYDLDANRLDDLIKVMLGSQNDESKPD